MDWTKSKWWLVKLYMIHKEEFVWEVMDAEVEEVVPTCDDPCTCQDKQNRIKS